MEVAQVEPTSTVGSQQVAAPLTSRFTWRIENFSRLNTKQHYSDVFVVGDYKWRVLIFPKGNNVDHDHLSMYLDVADSVSLPYGWSIFAHFSLSVVNQAHNKYTTRNEDEINETNASRGDNDAAGSSLRSRKRKKTHHTCTRKESEHQFNARESDWGFVSFMPLSELYDPSRGFVVNDTVVIDAEIRLKKEYMKKAHLYTKKLAHLYTIIKVARDKDLLEQIGNDVEFGLVDHDKVRSFHCPKYITFNLFKEEVAKEFGVPVEFQRFWIWAKRQNHTYGPIRPLTPQEETQSVGQLREVLNETQIAELKLFLEVEVGQDHIPAPLPEKTKEDYLIFFKLYDPEIEVFRYVGRLFVKSNSKPEEILAKLNKMAGFALDVEIDCYEEIKFDPRVTCKPLNKRISFRLNQIVDGDIICFQKPLPPEELQDFYCPDVPSFLKYVHNQQQHNHLYTIIKVARSEELLKQIGNDIYFDLVDHDNVRRYRYRNNITFNFLKKAVAKEIGVPVQFQRFWIWAKRQNHTYRPFRPLTPLEETQSVGRLREVSNETQLKLFLEVEVGQNHIPVPLPEKTKEDYLIFFKLYAPEKEELRYVGRLIVKSTSKPTEILGKLNKMAGFAPDVEIDCYEEIKFDPCVTCEPLNKRISFRHNWIEDGDIICFQKSLPPKRLQDFRYPDVPSFLEYVHNRQVVHFRALEGGPMVEDISLELSKNHSYNDVVERVARQIGLDDPSKLRLTSHNCYSQQPEAQPIQHQGFDRLTEMLVHYNQTSDVLYYKVLGIPLSELQGIKQRKVYVCRSSKDEAVMHNIRLPKVAQPNLDARPLPDIISLQRQASNSSAVAAKLGVSFADEPIELHFFNLDALEDDEDEQLEIPTPSVDADLVAAKKIIKEFCESKTSLVLASAAHKLQFTEALQTLQTVVPCSPEINASLATVPALTDKHSKHVQTAMQAQKKLDHISTSAEKYKQAATEMMQRKAAYNAKNQEAKAIVEEIARLEATLASMRDLKGEGQRIQEENAALNAEYSWLNNSKPTKTSFTEIKRGAEEEMKKLEKEWDDLLSTLLNTLPL